MKHLNLELEKLEQRIAPGGVTPPSGGGSASGGSGHSGSHHSHKSSKSHKSHKSHKSSKSHHSGGGSCGCA